MKPGRKPSQSQNDQLNTLVTGIMDHEIVYLMLQSIKTITKFFKIHQRNVSLQQAETVTEKHNQSKCSK